MVDKAVAVFDGDDTLWVVEPLYDRARMVARNLVAVAGLDGGLWDRTQRARDVENVQRLGLSPSRFPTSCVEAYRIIAESTGFAVDEELEREVWRAAEGVFNEVAPVVPNAREVLESLLAEFRLALMTRGDREVQERRIADSGLVSFFEVVEVVHEKTEHQFSALVKRMGVTPKGAWSIGNSLPSDINPALRCGMSAVWLDAHVWEYERREVVPHEGVVITANSLLEAGARLIASRRGRNR